jgi:hypothetical protein
VRASDPIFVFAAFAAPSMDHTYQLVGIYTSKRFSR